MATIVPIPCLNDNYAYMVEGTQPDVVAVVDPSEAEPVLNLLKSKGKKLGAVLITHHHWDHIGGLAELIKAVPDLAVMGFAGDAHRIAGMTHLVSDQQRLSLVGLDLSIRHIPGHTLGAIAIIVHEQEQIQCVFTGDTMFVGGCGRLFEGTPADMYRSLNDVLGELPDATEVYCGHEYTQANLRFAQTVEPDSAVLKEMMEQVATARQSNQPTVPSTIGQEKRINPYLRCSVEAVRAYVGLDKNASNIEVLAAIRQAKDSFGSGAKAGL
jgi:hydroxyacylglutathione hydrolase